MYYIFLFDLTPVIFGALLILFALADSVATALPFLCGLFWLLFAVYAVFSVILVFAIEGEGIEGIAKKFLALIVSVISLIFIGMISQDFFVELESAYGSGGLNGIFGFIITVIFGGAAWMMVLSGLSYASMAPVMADSNLKYVGNLLISCGILFLVCHFGI